MCLYRIQERNLHKIVHRLNSNVHRINHEAYSATKIRFLICDKDPEMPDHDEDFFKKMALYHTKSKVKRLLTPEEIEAKKLSKKIKTIKRKMSHG